MLKVPKLDVVKASVVTLCSRGQVNAERATRRSAEFGGQGEKGK
jgi:hypothetical protein